MNRALLLVFAFSGIARAGDDVPASLSPQAPPVCFAADGTLVPCSASASPGLAPPPSALAPTPSPMLTPAPTPGPTSVSTSTSSAVAPPSTSAQQSTAAQQNAQALQQAGSITDAAMTGAMLTGKAAAAAVGDATTTALVGKSSTVIGNTTAVLSGAAQIYNGYQQDGTSGLYRETAQVITDQAAQQAIINGSAAVGGVAFGPAGAEAGKLVGEGSVFVGGLVKNLPCGNSDVGTCVTVWEHDAINAVYPPFDCQALGVCVGKFAPANGDDLGADVRPDQATRSRMEAQFQQIDQQNVAAAEQAAAQQAAAQSAEQAAQNAAGDASGVSLMTGLMLGLASGQNAGPAAPLPPAPAAPAPSSGPPTGWVACGCPQQHASYGRWYSGTLYHPLGPKCSP